MSVKDHMDEISAKDNKDTGVSAARDARIGRALAGRLSGEKMQCPGPEKIALLIEGTLAEPERDPLLGHLASCGRCREVFVTARALTLQEKGEGAANSRRAWYLGTSLAAAAALALLALRLSPMVGPSAPPQLAQREAVQPQSAPVPVQSARRPLTAPSSKGEGGMVAKAAAGAKSGTGPVDLLSAAEAAMPASKTYGFAGERSDGPLIEVESPAQDGEEAAVASIRITFTPQQGEQVDLASVRIECLKENSIDLTPRLKPYLSADGIKVEKVRAPAGLHRFRVSVADYQGRFSDKEFSVHFSGRF